MSFLRRRFALSVPHSGGFVRHGESAEQDRGEKSGTVPCACKAYQLFGKELWKMLDEVLAA